MRTQNIAMKEKICVALDVSTRKEALDLVRSLQDLTGMFKMGLQLFTAEGPPLVREIIAAGAKVFLDLKFHDIPNTVKNAAVEAARLGVSMMTIHTVGGKAMMQAAATELRSKFPDRRPILVGVTVLTSLDDSALRDIGVDAGMNTQVLRMAKLAETCGLDGVVCSPREIQQIRGVVGPSFKIVTPGIRLPGQSIDDQQRTATPKEAIAAGADYLVVGRPVTHADNPLAALESLLQSL
jgi:orotidine-5'-phosphate decarboxylase